MNVHGWYQACMHPRSEKDVVGRLRTALDMFGLGESIMRQKLRRTFPAASEKEIEEKIWLWLSHRPGAEAGDAPGRRRDLAHSADRIVSAGQSGARNFVYRRLHPKA